MRRSSGEMPVAPNRARWESTWLEFVVHADHDETVRERAVALAREDGSWTRLLDRFERETLVERAAVLLTSLRAGSVPAPVLEDLRARRHVHHATGLVYVETLRTLLAALAEAGVRALAFKGPVLAQLAYGAPTARGYGDLDLLVPPAHRFRAAAVLEAAGYRPAQLVAPRGASRARHHTAVAFEAEDRVDVDLHWAFSTPLVPFDLTRAGLWKRTREITVGGVWCRTLSSADTLLHTCFRGAKDDYVYWTALADMAALLAAEHELDWDLVGALAKRTGARRMLHLALLLAQDVAGASLPEQVERAARADRRAVDLATSAASRLRSGRPVEQDIRGRLTRAVRLRERPGDRFSAVLGAVTRVSEPRTDERWPRWTWPVRRPLRLLRDLRRDDRPPLGGASP
ncbi:MAG: nucleotidyltransferase family protein [Planctomycetota bacterium]|nr:nucleotidyltransferase family protein [Planctomycetota bacterium]